MVVLNCPYLINIDSIVTYLVLNNMNSAYNKTEISAKFTFIFKITLTMYEKTNENAYEIRQNMFFLNRE